jgi:two-component sensor histidine kinase/DNA-binding response OmpR family regulator
MAHSMDPCGKINVLLVDDQPAKLLSYEVMLAELGENLMKVSSAREALEALLKTEIAVVLIDVCMPDLDGFELAAMIRDHPRFQKTAIIFVSAVHLTETDHLRGYSAGAVDYVPVPVVPQVLRAKVKVFAELFRKTKQLEHLNAELERRVTERTAALEASTGQLMESERARGLALAAGNMGSWEYNTADNGWTWDEGHSRIFGIEPPLRYSGPAQVSAFFNEADWALLRSVVDRATPENNTFQCEMRVRRNSGEVRYCVVSTAVTFGEGGTVQRLNGVTLDITDRKEAENRQALLAREVDHRARNTLAVVQSIVRLTRARTMDAYTDAIEGRIGALAHAQELLSQSRWQGADIVRLVTEEMAPYRMGDGSKISIVGSSVILAPDRAQAVALSLHELATNAAKYGALSSQSGRVAIAWRIESGILKLDWRESGGPEIQPPQVEGFGTKIINASIKGQSHGNVSFDWRPEGLHCALCVPCSVGEPRDADSSEPAMVLRAGSVVRRILLAEDEALLSLLMRDVLDGLGYDIAGPFSSLADALKAARTEDIAGAVLDVNLGGEYVYPLAELLSASEIPFVFVTGYAKEGIDPRFVHVPVLRKPLTRESLEMALGTILARAEHRLALRA